jgi:glycosyltransferase involved in cell wall biosynthesis
VPKVLQINDKPATGGGIRRVVDQHRAMLESLGWHCQELRLVPADDRGSEDVLTARIGVGLRMPADSASVSVARTAAQAADVVQLHLGFASLSSAFVSANAAEAPLVVHLHDVSPFEGLGLPEFGPDPRPDSEPLLSRLQRLRLAPVRRAVWQRLCMDARAIVAPSQYLARLAKAAGAPPERVVVVPHAADKTAEAASPPSACGPVVLFAGFLSKQKGATMLLDAFAKMTEPSAELLFVGDGPERANLQRLAARLPRVRFLGRMSADDVALEMSKARVVAHPSLVPEGFGLVGIEAMQVGRPVVGFGLGGCAEWLINGETGLVADQTTARSLAASLDEVLRDGALADRLGEAGRRHVERHFSTECVARQLSAVLRSVMCLPAGGA